MDGIHDLGGKKGYGAVDVNEPEIPFKSDYEGRMWALSRTARVAGIGIDWWRHCRELIKPDDYLNRSYFDSWAQTEMATMIDAGVCTMTELLTGNSVTGTYDGPPSLTYDQVLLQNTGKVADFSRSIETQPAFNTGDQVRTSDQGHTGHTRLPKYARSKTGKVIKYHGAHVYPDDGAKGVEFAGHLYTIAFNARDLWGSGSNPNDQVMLELWETYLAPA